jgi:DNA-directed RNA polymerase subunit beta
MHLSFTDKKKIRKSFGKLENILKIPDLIEVQRFSYNSFLKLNEEGKSGLDKVFKEVFPIEDFAGHATIEYISYRFENEKYDVAECKQRGLTYSAPLKVILRLVAYDINEEAQTKQILSAKEQEVYMSDVPLMTEKGTFVINGTDRVVVNQMHRSPGLFLDHDKGKSHSSGKLLFNCRVIPYRGSWLDLEYDIKDILYFRIDRKRKIPVTTLLMALGYAKDEILNLFHEPVKFDLVDDSSCKTKFFPEKYKNAKLRFDLIDADTNKKIAKEGTKVPLPLAQKLQREGLKNIVVNFEELQGRYFANDIINEKTGEVYFESGDEVTSETAEKIKKLGIRTFYLSEIDGVNIGSYLRNTLVVEKNNNSDDACMDIYRVLRPGEPPTVETSRNLFNNLFFNNTRYDLSDVGRVKLNNKLDLDVDVKNTVLTKDDIIKIVAKMLRLKDGKEDVDDIDHLGNRRVRSVGELVENQFRIGLVRMERAIKEKMSSVEIDTVMPQDLINSKPIAASLKEFFGTSQLSQFMDQTNPLAEITHKRRVSALGPGGLTRERAGFEVRDVHPTHYGRICPIETPEGPNIGLINSLATYSKVNRYGFIESPYRVVKNGKVTKEIHHLSAMEEGKFTIAQANSILNDDNSFKDELVSCRKNLGFELAKPESIDYMDVSPKQVVSVAAALIPFLENDDANRALMGSNMMRQAVPLIKNESPLVGTGMEKDVALDSGATIVARREGVVEKIDGKRIVVKALAEKDLTKSSVDIYNLQKFQRSNQNTCTNQRPLVKVGDLVKQGDVIADGPSTHFGELALGKNVMVAFMPWLGYNFEDSILISERCVSEDVFTSIHIEEYDVMARDTKLGPEEITRDIPNTSEEALRNLDESGIVYVGAEVKPGDILVGKLTPKGDTKVTSEEKLLRAIFGEKAIDVRDTSLKMPSGTGGTVVEVRVFNRHGIEKDERALSIEKAEIESVLNDKQAEETILEMNIKSRAIEILEGTALGDNYKKITKGTKLTKQILLELSLSDTLKLSTDSEKSLSDLAILKEQYSKAKKDIQVRFDDKVDKIERGDELLPGVMKMVKVFVAMKRKLQPGDKMAGRHGNKGVISKIVPAEDMPYMANGKPVDIVLNPLGVPSRMNVGQILETHLGWACSELGEKIKNIYNEYQKNVKNASNTKDALCSIYNDKEIEREIQNFNTNELSEVLKNLSSGAPIATPVFDGASVEDVTKMLKFAGLPESGQTTLFDGRTGEKFDRDVTVGIIYMLKLYHMVDDKIHARSTGPYSLVTQQPLGGKAQFGGQRFGEMEVWALEAYGAAYTLQEILTVKSDDVAGRTKVYETIVKGDDDFESGIPESFNVLVKEIRSLALNLELN